MDIVDVASSEKRNALFTFAKLPHVSERAPKRWVHMACEGTWKGHHSGREITFTRELFAAFVQRFTATKNATAIKYGHPDGDDFVAAGWILDMEIRDSGLWCLAEFTPPAAKRIADGEYRYCSVEFALESIDRVTGEVAGPVLSGLALTNVPFLDGLQAITLSRVGTPARDQAQEFHMATEMQPSKVLAQIAKDLGLKADATVDAILKKFNAIAAYMKAIEEPSSVPAEVITPEELSADPVKASAFAARVTTALSNRKARALITLSDDLMETPADAESAASATMIADKLMTLTSLDAPGVLAALDANGDAIAAAFTGVAASGTPAETSALSTKATELKLVMASNAALGARLSVLESDNAALKAAKAAAEKATADAAKEAAIGELIAFAVEKGHCIESQRAELTDYARERGVEKARAFILTLSAPPTSALTKDASVAKGAALPPKADDANGEFIVDPHTDEEKRLIRQLSNSPKKTQASALKTWRAKHAGA